MKKSKISRVISFVIVLMMVLSGTQGFFVEASTYGINDIVLEKNATPADDDNTYDIQLSVKGKEIVTGEKADVILVIDNSNSMHDEKYNNETLAQITRKAANALIDGVLNEVNNQSKNVRVSVVQYGTYARAYQFNNEKWTNNWRENLNINGTNAFTTDNAKAKAAVDKATTVFSNNSDGGTNTEGGFLMASKVALAGRSDAEKIVVFMTDGMPTFRYDENSSVSDGRSWWLNGGIYTSKWELNEAIEAGQELSRKSTIYTVALLSAFEKNSDEAKLASNLLSASPKKYGSDYDRRNIMPHVDKNDRWSNTTSYVEKYYPIFSDKNAAEEMENIYETIGSSINALANGYVKDIIPEYFELTEDSKERLEREGVTVKKNGTTALEFPNISAGGTKVNLPEFTVKAKAGYYGTAFTNDNAYYKFKLYGEDVEQDKDFVKPIVLINTTAIDDSYSMYVGESLNINATAGILKNDNESAIKLQVKDYTVTDLKVDEGEISTTQGGTVVLNDDGSFTYNPPSPEFTGTDTFVYKNYATVSGDGPLSGEDCVSNEATVTITVVPAGTNTASYTIEHYLQNSDFETYSKKSEDTTVKSGLIGSDVSAKPNKYTGYEFNLDASISEGEVLEDGSLTLKLYYDAIPYKVYYHPNNGKDDMIEDDDNPYIFGEQVVVAENSFINEGYVFVGWGYQEIELTPMSLVDFGKTFEPNDTFTMPDADVILYALWEEEEPVYVDYEVRYLDKDTEEELHEITTGTGIVGEEITVSAIDIKGYKPVEPTEETLTLEEGDNVIIFFYEKIEEPEEPEDGSYILINHYTKTGEDGNEVLAKTNKVLHQVTSGSAVKYGKDYKDDSIIEEGFEFIKSVPESLEVYAPGTTGAAIEYIFNLYYYRDKASYTLTYNPNGGSGTMEDETYYEDDTVTVKNNGFTRSGYSFTGWNTEANGSGTSYAVGTTFKIKDNITLYAQWTSSSSPGPGGGGGGGGSTVIDDPEVPLADLERVDHFAYLIGYPEGDFRPLNNITREEVAVIFYRLLTDESRDEFLSDSNSFTDIEDDRWSNRAISTLYNADIISGYPDGTFKPSEPITRAEFATIAAKFDDLELGGTTKFTDVIGHWAEEYITSSELKGWINGYPDNTFRPEQDITRAEAVTLINNVLGRIVKKENIHPDAMFWPDVSSNDWFFEAVMEASNSHDYIYDEETFEEIWSGMKPNKIWP